MEPTTHNLEITNDALACRMFGNREKYDQLCDEMCIRDSLHRVRRPFRPGRKM